MAIDPFSPGPPVNSGSKRPRQPGTARPGGVARTSAFGGSRTTARSGAEPLLYASQVTSTCTFEKRPRPPSDCPPTTRIHLQAASDQTPADPKQTDPNMQPWSPPENGLVLTDLLRRGPPQQQQPREAVYVKPEPNFVSSRPGMVDLPPLLPPRAPTLPAFSDVLRTTSPQQQRYQYENENAMAANRAPASDTSDAGYSLPAATRDSYPTDHSATYSATFMTRPNASEFAKPVGFVLPNGPTRGPYAAATGDTTPPGMAGARTRPIGDGSPIPREATARPASRTCRFAGCTHYVVDHGLCVRHGGGKRCTAEGCSSRAKHFGRCWKHGGSIECKAPGCSNRAKSRGYCWSHGGGTKCKTGACEKIAISNGLCWAHGGGKRCIVPGCRKQAYERTCNYCNSHFQQYQQTALELARHQPSA